MQRKNKIWLLLLISVIAVYAFRYSTERREIKNSYVIPTSLFHTGDIIFRDGRGVISSLFRNMSLTDQSYSHAGIIHFEKNIPFVYHVIGGEKNNACMRKERLCDFCSRNNACAFGIYRTRLNENEIDSVTETLYRKGIKFDDKFDLSTDSLMYCSEMVYKVLKKVSKTDNFLPLTTVRNISYVSCDNIFLSPHLTKIYSYKYE